MQFTNEKAFIQDYIVYIGFLESAKERKTILKEGEYSLVMFVVAIRLVVLNGQRVKWLNFLGLLRLANFSHSQIYRLEKAILLMKKQFIQDYICYVGFMESAKVRQSDKENNFLIFDCFMKNKTKW